MKALLFILGFLLARASLVHGFTLCYLWEDKFHQPAGSPLAGTLSDSGTRWESVGPAGVGITVQAGQLEVPGLPIPEGNRVRLAGVNGPGARVGFGTNVSAGTFYYSLTLRVTDRGSLGPNGGALAAFNNATGPSQTLPAPLASRLLVRSNGRGYQLGLSKSSTNTADFAWAPPTFSTNDVVFVVAAYEFKDGGADAAHLWINPSAATFGESNAPSPTVSTSAGPNLPNVQSFVLLQRPQPIQPAVAFVDELRVGNLWAAVTPPGTADLAVTVAGPSGPVAHGENLTLSVTVTNKGLADATDARLTVPLPAGLDLVSASASQGSCQVTPGGVQCDLALIQPGRLATVNLVIVPDFDKLAAADKPAELQETVAVTNTLSVTAVGADARPADNSFALVLFVLPWRDFGDAPTGYPVLLAENGARHRFSPNWRLGVNWDRNVMVAHSPGADWDDLHDAFGALTASDDEDGVVFLTTLGGILVQVTALHDGYLNAWMDFNRDADWADLGEHIITDAALLAGVPKNFSIAVPAGTSAGQFFSRWRLSETKGLSDTGYGGKGEVEDHVCDWTPETVYTLDYGDAPDSYFTYAASGGPSHAMAAGEYLGLKIDGEPDGQPIDLDGVDEDGVSFPATLPPGTMVVLNVTASMAGKLDGWIDFNHNGMFDVGAGSPEAVCVAVPLVPGVNAISIHVPPGAGAGGTWARFRFSLAGGLPPGGPAPDGEVEDYGPGVVTIGGNPNPVDLKIAWQDVDPEGEILGQPVQYAVRISNASSHTAERVEAVLTHAGLPVAGIVAESTLGTCRVVGAEVHCTVPLLAPGQSEAIQISVTPQTAGKLMISAAASSGLPDLQPIDNQIFQGIPVWPTSPECACSCFSNSPAGDVLLSSWFTKNSGQYAQMYWQTGAATRDQWEAGPPPPGKAPTYANSADDVVIKRYADVQKVQADGEFVYITAYGLASYVMGPWYCSATELFPNWPDDQTRPFKFPFEVDLSVCEDTGLDAIGLWVNGTAIYNVLDGFFYDPTSEDPLVESEGKSADVKPGPAGAVWHRDAWSSEKETFDPARFHTTGDGQYHSHANPTTLRLQLGDNIAYYVKVSPEGTERGYQESTHTPTHSPILGWAFDGHPVYGPYGYSDPTNSASGVRRMRSGYVKRDGSNGTTDLTTTGRSTLPIWARQVQSLYTKLDAKTQYGPPTSRGDDLTRCNAIPFDLGRYAEDNAFLGHLINPADGDLFHQGEDYDLDVHNGRCCVTPEFPNGVYAYFVTIDETGEPAYPYILGWQYCGKPTGGEKAQIPNTGVTTYYSAQQARLDPVQNLDGSVTLQWSSREGGQYRLLGSADLQNWSVISSSLPSGGTNSTYTLDPAQARSPQQFFKVELERDGGGHP